MISDHGADIDADIGEAIVASHFRDLPDETIADLVAGSHRIHVAAGSAVRLAGEEGRIWSSSSTASCGSSSPLRTAAA